MGNIQNMFEVGIVVGNLERKHFRDVGTDGGLA
jgi:hypothetical protein